MSRHKIQSSRPYFPPEDIEQILQTIRLALETGQILAGREVESLEKEFAEYIGVAHAVAVSSGTSALEIIFRYFGITDRKVLVPTNSFIASANAVIFAGGKPVLMDTSPEHLCADFADLRGKADEKAAIVEIVHIAGMLHPEIFEIREWCKRRRLILVEDAAHAHGATINGIKAGAIGDAAAFSFYPTKIMAGGEGGIITTGDSKLAAFARTVRAHGVNQERLSDRLGYNWRMHEFAAVLLRKQLERLEEFLATRNRIASVYFEAFSALRGLRCVYPPEHIRHGWYKFPVVLESAEKKVELAHVLRNEYGIDTTGVYYPHIHQQPVYQKLMPNMQLPKSEVLSRVLCLPVHCQMSEEDVTQVVKAVKTELAS